MTRPHPVDVAYDAWDGQRFVRAYPAHQARQGPRPPSSLAVLPQAPPAGDRDFPGRDLPRRQDRKGIPDA